MFVMEEIKETKTTQAHWVGSNRGLTALNQKVSKGARSGIDTIKYQT